MTPLEAAALALIGVHDRRLLAALIRAVSGRATSDDHEALPPRADGEPLISWACRCRSGTGSQLDPRNPASLVDSVDRLEKHAAGQLAQGVRLGAAAVPLLDARYPALLAAIPDPPALLWIRGNVPVVAAPAIAIVGSRAATPHGIAVAAKLAAELAAAGLVVVSGLARGVDSAAHAAALSAGGKTVGVLGCGIDRLYPAEHRDLARNMLHVGAVVSEYPPGVPPLPHHFPQRNRIISGLAGAVVVVEAPEKSGALITAASALEQGRDVMVVPGPTTGGRNRGGHLLIRDGAKVVETADDILQELGAMLCQSSRIEAGTEFRQLPDMTDFTVDDVADKTGEGPNVVLARLLDLELAGRIRRIGGGRFVRVN